MRKSLALLVALDAGAVIQHGASHSVRGFISTSR